MGSMTVQVKRPNQEINVSITDMDNLEIMKFLREILAGDPKVINVPISQPLKVTKDFQDAIKYGYAGGSTSVQYPTSENLTEPTEQMEQTATLPRGTSVLIDVNCPDCNHVSTKMGKAGMISSCSKCGTILYTEPGVNGRYKAVTNLKKK